MICHGDHATESIRSRRPCFVPGVNRGSVARNHPLRRSEDDGRGAGGAVWGVRRDVRQGWATVDSTEAAVKASVLMALYRPGAGGSSASSWTTTCSSGGSWTWTWSASFVPTVFTKNRERLIEHDVARQFFAQVVAQARGAGLMSDDHFTVDGTLIEAWASQKKSFRRKDEEPGDRPPPDDPGNPSVDFMARSAATRRTSPKSDPRQDWPANRRILRRSWRIPNMPSWRTVTAYSWIFASQLPMGRRSATWR